MLNIALLDAACAQTFETVPAPDTANLVGTIYAKLKLRMKFTKQGNNLTGTCAYEMQNKDINLCATVNDMVYFQFDEYGAKDTITGHFVRAYTSYNVVVGFGGKDESSTSPKLPVRLVEDAKATVSVTTNSRSSPPMSKVILAAHKFC